MENAQPTPSTEALWRTVVTELNAVRDECMRASMMLQDYLYDLDVHGRAKAAEMTESLVSRIAR